MAFLGGPDHWSCSGRDHLPLPARKQRITTFNGEMIMKCVTFYWLLVLWAFTMVGCGSKKADENKPMSEVKTEAEKMDAGQLRNMAVTYKEAIVAKTAEVEKITAKLKEIPVTELLGEQAKQLKANIDSVTKSIDALKARFDVYYAKLKEKSGDLSGLEL
jgi:hypothetical protein